MASYRQRANSIEEASKLALADTKELFANHKKVTLGDWNSDLTEILLLEGLVCLFALWSVNNSPEEYFQTDDEDYFFVKPHAVQVISLMRLFNFDGCANNQRSIQNHLIQIKTGEGKSVTLAVAACIFALLGFEVDCICYSKYLSERDSKEFSEIFRQLEIEQLISYSTFKKMCEKSYTGLRKLGKDFIDGKLEKDDEEKEEIENHQKKKVLLLDEVDVFFGDTFYGESYIPVIALRDENLFEIQKMIWESYEDNYSLSLKEVISTECYQNLIKRFPKLEKVIEQSVDQMMNEVEFYNEHEYFCDKSNQRIGYKSHDEIDYLINYGFKTLFAYFNEYNKGTIFENTLREQCHIKLAVGQISYAEVVKQYPLILGVSGTLDVLCSNEKKILGEFRISKESKAPSVFGDSTLRFDLQTDFVIEDTMENYHNKIFSKLKECRESNRACLVFFDSESKLNGFREFNDLKGDAKLDSINLLSEQTKDKDQIVKKATATKGITLLPRVFGRGVDFICRDEEVLKNGGCHVIQTFYSLEKSEEIQIKGRTSRQGQEGSYEVILLKKDIKDLFKKNLNTFESLDEQRKKILSKKTNSRIKKAEKALQSHQETNRFHQLLRESNPENDKEIVEALYKLNDYQEPVEARDSFFDQFLSRFG